METFLVGIGHKARQGKNFLAAQLHAQAPSLSQIYTFSDPIISFARVSGMMGSRKDPVVLQNLADAFEKRDPGFWLKQLTMKIEDDPPRLAIIPGVRLKNQFEWIKSEGGLVVRVNRLNANGVQWIAPDRPANHHSEIDLDGAPFDYSVSARSGDLQELIQCSKKLMAHILERMK